MTNTQRDAMQQALDALEYAHATNRHESARQALSITALRKALASSQPAKCWKCGDTDPALQSACDVPSCGMREVLAAANSVKFDGTRTEPAQQAPVVWMPRTWAERYVSGVGAVTCSLRQMAGWVPLYTAPPSDVPLLTAAEIVAIMRGGNNCNYNDEGEHVDFAREIEKVVRQKAGIK